MRPKSSPKREMHKFAWPGVLILCLAAAGIITFTMRTVDISGLVAAATSSLTQAPVTLYMTPYDVGKFTLGDVKKIDVIVNAEVPINAIGTTIKFPPDSLEVLGFSKEKSFFDLWTEETAIHEDIGEVHFSGGTTRKGGLVGTGTVITLTVRAKKSGEEKMIFKDPHVYAADGEGSELETESRSLSLVVENPPASTYVPVTSASAPEKPLPRTPDVNSDGIVNLIDVSIMIMRLVMPYDYHFDLNMDGAINIADISIVLSQVHK